MLTQTRRQARARLASNAARAARRPDDLDAQQAVADARRDYRATALEEYIERTIAQAPPLTTEQRSRLAAILQAGAA